LPQSTAHPENAALRQRSYVQDPACQVLVRLAGIFPSRRTRRCGNAAQLETDIRLCLKAGWSRRAIRTKVSSMRGSRAMRAGASTNGTSAQSISCQSKAATTRVPSSDTEDHVQHEQATLRHHTDELPASAQSPRRARRGAGIWQSSISSLLCTMRPS